MAHKLPHAAFDAELGPRSDQIRSCLTPGRRLADWAYYYAGIFKNWERQLFRDIPFSEIDDGGKTQQQWSSQGDNYEARGRKTFQYLYQNWILRKEKGHGHGPVHKYDVWFELAGKGTGPGGPENVNHAVLIAVAKVLR